MERLRADVRRTSPDVPYLGPLRAGRRPSVCQIAEPAGLPALVGWALGLATGSRASCCGRGRFERERRGRRPRRATTSRWSERILAESQQRLCAGGEYFVVWGLFSGGATDCRSSDRPSESRPLGLLWVVAAALAACVAFSVCRARALRGTVGRESLVQREFFNVLWLTLGLAFVVNVGAYRIFSGWRRRRSGALRKRSFCSTSGCTAIVARDRVRRSRRRLDDRCELRAGAIRRATFSRPA